MRTSASNLDDTVYALDSSTVDLCLSVFGWAPFRATKAAVKLHTLLDLRGSLPSFIHVSDGKLHDVKALDLIVPEPAADLRHGPGLCRFPETVPTASGGSLLRHAGEEEPCLASGLLVPQGPRARHSGGPADLVALDGKWAQQAYPLHLRRVRYQDPDSGKRLVFLTNRRDLAAVTVCALYKQRWI